MSKTKEVEYVLGLQKDVNPAEIRDVEIIMQRHVGNFVMNQEGKVDWSKVSMIDFMIHASQVDPAALDTILDNAPVAKDNPVLIQSMIANLLLQGVKPADLGKVLKDMGMEVAPHQLPDVTIEQSVPSQDEGLSKDESFGLMDLLKALLGGDEKEGELVEFDDDLINKWSLIIQSNEVIATRFDGNDKIATTGKGGIVNLLVNTLTKNPDLDITKVVNECKLNAKDSAQKITRADGKVHEVSIEELIQDRAREVLSSSMQMSSEEVERNSTQNTTKKAIDATIKIDEAIGGSRASFLDEIRQAAEARAQRLEKAAVEKEAQERVGKFGDKVEGLVMSLVRDFTAEEKNALSGTSAKIEDVNSRSPEQQSLVNKYTGGNTHNTRGGESR